MKQRKNILILTVIFLLSLTGCQKIIEPADSDAFVKAMSDTGLEAEDDSNNVNEVWSAKNDDVSYTFYKFESADEAKTGYIYIKMNLDSNYTSDNLNTSTVSKDNYEKYEVDDSTTYSVISRIDNTVIYAYSNDMDNADDIKNIMKKLGY